MTLQPKTVAPTKFRFVIAFFATLLLAVYPVSEARVLNAFAESAVSVTSQNELEGALAGDSSVISLTNSFTVDKQITISRPVTIQGNGKTITSAFMKSVDNSATIGIRKDNVTLNNLIVDGSASTSLQGITVSNATDVHLNDVTIKDHTAGSETSYGLVVGAAATLEAANLKTSGNDAGVKVDGEGQLTVKGQSTHSEEQQLLVNEEGALVDVNGQYKAMSGGIYTLKPAPARPMITSPADGATITSSDQVTVTWNPVEDADAYSVIVDSGNPVMVHATSFSRSFENGSHTVSVAAMTASGLSSEPATVTFIVNVDTVPPSVSGVDIESSSLVSGGSVVFKGTITGLGETGTAKLYITEPGKSDATEIDITGNIDDMNGDWQYELKNISAGTYKYVVMATDQAGNQASTSEAFFKVAPLQAAPTDTTTGTNGQSDSDRPVETEETASVSTFAPVGMAALNTPVASVLNGDSSKSSAPQKDSSKHDKDVLGSQDEGSGTKLSNTAIFDLKAGRFFGMTWVGWLVVFMALVIGWLFLAAAIRRRRGVEY